jgi:hypothetical protein
MRKLLTFILLLSTFIACTSDAPKQTPPSSQPFIVEATSVDPATDSLIMSIKLDAPFTEANAKKAAEIVIEQNKARFKNITVRSYTQNLSQNPLPYAVSVFDGNTVTHQITPQLAPQKIPSH